MIKGKPDFETLQNVLLGESKPESVPLAEFAFDEEVIHYIVKNDMEKTPASLPPEELATFMKLDSASKEEYWKMRIEFFTQMGYDFMTVLASYHNLPDFRFNQADDPSVLTRGRRNWLNEASAVVTSWEDFEKIPWDDIHPDTAIYDFLEKILPEGMKVMVDYSMFEMIMENFLGYEGLFLMMYDNPELVDKLFQTWGELVYTFYKNIIARDCVGGIFHSDDLGFKTGTFLPPDYLRKHIFPHFKEYATLAHKHDKMFWIHSCGNLSEIMDDLIDYVKIDAYHSYQDVIMPVTEFKKQFGSRVAILGGVDVDKLARMPENELRPYVREILDTCMPGGRFALGSGNTVTNYMPPENYLAMRDEAMKWKG